MATAAAIRNEQNYSCDLRDWLKDVKRLEQLEQISGAHWDLELGALTEIILERISTPPAVVFDNVPGFEPGRRVLANMLIDAEWNGLRRSDVEQRMLAEGHGYGESLSRLHRFLVMHLAVLAGGNIQTDFVLVLQHHAIAADVFDSGFRIARDNQMSRTEVTSAVAGMPARHRELHQVDFITALNILKDGPLGDYIGFDRLHCAQTSSQCIDEGNRL